MDRGNEAAAVDVRPHAYVGAALLLAAALALLAPRFVGADARALATLGAATLLLQAVLFWYLPSFAKRRVVLDGMATYAGPILLPVALAVALVPLPLRDVALGLALALFGGILLASAAFGPRWRSGVPFWRAEGQHRRGDLAAMLALASGALWLLAEGVALLLWPREGARALAVAWPAALALLALGALAHLVPRARGRPLAWRVFLAGAAAFQLGAALFALADAPRVAGALVAGLPVCALAMAGPGKRAGPRMRDARPALAGAAALAAATVALLAAGMTTTGYVALLVALLLAVAAVTLLALPVVFNQRPDARAVAPGVASALAGVALNALARGLPLGRWPAAVALAAALLLWLAALAPLRRPRRACPPEAS